VEKDRLRRKEKVYERIGRAKQKYPTIWKYYDIDAGLEDKEKDVLSLNWHKKERQREHSGEALQPF